MNEYSSEDMATAETRLEEARSLMDAFRRGLEERAARVDQIGVVLRTADPVVARGLEIERAQDLLAARDAAESFRLHVTGAWSFPPAAREAQLEVARLAGKWAATEPFVAMEVRRSDDVIEGINELHVINSHHSHIPLPTVEEADHRSWETMDLRATSGDRWEYAEAQLSLHQAMATVHEAERAASLTTSGIPAASDARLTAAAGQARHPRAALTSASTPETTYSTLTTRAPEQHRDRTAGM